MVVNDNNSTIRSGFIYSILAYGIWGLGPIYFKAVASVAPAEVLAHRIIWSVLFLVIVALLTNGINDIIKAFRSSSVLKFMAGTTILISINWYTFIWAIENNQILQASLGYFINPLISVLLGAIFLRERLNLLSKISILLAAVGVIILLSDNGVIPVAGLVLAITFAFYGLLRKVAPVKAVTGLTVETILLCPIAVGYIIYLHFQNNLAFGISSINLSLLLICAGPVTSLPLIWFAKGARRLKLATVGFLQYITPTLHFLLAVVVYNEPFGLFQMLAFGSIWIGLAIYTYNIIKHPEHSK